MLWLVRLAMLLCLLCVLIITNRKSSRLLNILPIEGTVVILNENGEEIPFQKTGLTVVTDQTQFLWIDESWKLGGKKPIFAATLFFSTEDGKYAAVECRKASVVDSKSDKPSTQLAVKLRPRYSVKGRLVDDNGIPYVNRSIELICDRTSEFKDVFPYHYWRERTLNDVFYSRATTTDSEGFFTVDNVIPGTEYGLIVYSLPHGEYGHRAATLDMPLLLPEQYQQPFDLGDVSVSGSATIRFDNSTL